MSRIRLIFSVVFALLASSTSQATDSWLYSGRIGGAYIYNQMSDADLGALLDERAAQNVSILELDSQLSYYLSEAEFDAEVAFLDKAAEFAQARGMQAVIYYPTFEVLTRNAIDANGNIAASTMARDNPDWVQWGLDGTPNVFYGGQEVWVSPGEESAWLSPNSGYRDYFISRVERLAATDLDGVWLDVPIYLDTGTPWPGTEPAAAADFKAWTIDQGLNGGAGYDVPTAYNMDDPRWRAWIKWRHINVADFLNDVRAAAQAINPDFAVIIENFPLDYFDSTAYGLDGSYIPVEDNFITVWETDSVSNTQAMKWSTPDDFENKLAMLKWGKSVHGNQPSWSFSYGFEPLDAALTMAATVATQNVPFESQTPTMLNSVGSEFRTNWFGYVRDHEPELLRVDRVPELAIWYSSATRDFQDYQPSGKFGLYSVTTPPTEDNTWWAKRFSDSIVTAPHIGAYRGFSAAMMRMNIPYTVVHGTDQGPLASIDELPMLILPSVGAMSNADAAYIRQYVENGGVLLATGSMPGILDETGAARADSAIADLLNFPSSAISERVNRFGNGLAIYRPDIIGTKLFGAQLDENEAADTLTEIEKLVRIHVDEPFTLVDGEDIYVDRAIASDNEHLLYVVNYSGLQLPLVQSVKPVVIDYRAPAGKIITSVVASTPDSNGLNGFATLTYRGEGIYRVELPVDQFALLEVQLADAPVKDPVAYTGPQFDDPVHREAAESGLAFVLNNMRDSAAPEPYRFGVYTNLIDNEDSTEIYTNGHNVTGEHMGLLLRTAACMGNEIAFDEAFRYVNEVMVSPLYHVPNWSVDKNTREPFVYFDDFRNNWYNANAPLDDLRVIHGLVDGYENFGRRDSNALADSMLEGLYWTSVTDRGRNPNNRLFPQYPGGLLGFAWDWSETDDSNRSPPARATGTGYLGTDLIPVDYQDLGTIAHAAERDARWGGVLQSTTQLLLDSEINLSGLYYNGYRPNGVWTGDFEFQGTRRGEHLKTIQVLWTAIHLARASKSNVDALTTTQKSLAQSSAQRSLSFFKNFYQVNSRVPEYLQLDGSDVPDCTTQGVPANCLARGSESLFIGEARIYAQIARLATLLGDAAFANQMINERIISDRIDDQSSARYGMIGLSTAGSNDAEAWNVLESVFSICLNAMDDDTAGPPIDDNNAPIANEDSFSTNEETALILTAPQILANDTDDDNDTLFISGLPSRSTGGNSVILQTDGTWRYTPDIGFTGADSISYAISDGRGGTSIGQINIDVRLVPKSTHMTEAVTVLTGALNYGFVEFLSSDDADTYDVDSAPDVGGNVVDINIKGRIEKRSEVTRLIATYSGHYSVDNVNQETYLYNYASLTWDLFDSRVVGASVDSIVRIDVTDNPRNYIAADGETLLRVKGTQSSTPAAIWANSVSWLAYRGDIPQGNTAPIAATISVSTFIDTPVNIRISGIDPQDSPITYTLSTGGLSGSISGTAPNLTYTPPSGFSGTESFTYSTNDGELSSEPATVIISVLQPDVVSNIAAGLTLDGNLSEWSGFIPFPADPAEINSENNPLDWRQAWMAHDGAYYYIAFVNEGDVNPSWGQTTYFDIDDNPATGAQFGLPIGADRVLQGRFLYRYTGSGNDWNWEFITEVVGQSNNGSFEYRIPREAFDNSELLKLAFIGSNVPYGGTTEDLYPDTVYTSDANNRNFVYTAVAPSNTAPDASDLELVTSEGIGVETTLPASDIDGDALSYTIVDQPQNGTLSGTAPQFTYLPAFGFNGEDSFTFQVNDGAASSRVATVTITVVSADDTGILSNPVTQMTIDGILTEWQRLEYFEDDGDDISGAENPVDYLRAAMAHDDGFFYLTFTNDGQDLTTLQNWLFTVYIDADLDLATGYNSGLAIGAEYMQQGTGVYSYAGTGPDWIWTPMTSSTRGANASNVELSIPRQSIGDPDRLRIVLIGDNFSVEGGVSDHYPDGTYTSTAAVRYLEYTTGGQQSVPVALAALPVGDLPVSGREELIQNPVDVSRRPLRDGGGSLSMAVLLSLTGLILCLILFRQRSATVAIKAGKRLWGHYKDSPHQPQ